MNPKFYTDIMAELQRAAYLEKNASDERGLAEKANHAWGIFLTVKTAGLSQFMGQAAKHPFGKGLMMAGGAAIPAIAAGAYLTHNAGEEARDTTRDARNKAIQTALAVGALGAGLYGMHRASQPSTKQASLVNKDRLIEKLATVGFLDTLLEQQEKHPTIGSDARECRKLNAEHGVDILQQLLD